MKEEHQNKSNSHKEVISVLIEPGIIKLMEIERMLPYYTPTNDWQPQKYNFLIGRIEQIIIELQTLRDENKEVNCKKAKYVLNKYLTLREKYF